jgi:hypothetical protein
MVGFVEPNRYQPRAGWKARLDSWVQFSPGAAGSWQVDMSLYWRWRTLQGLTVTEAWTKLQMHQNNARSSLDPNSADKGMIPPELFSRVLARSRAAAIDPNDEVVPVIIDAEPTPAAAAAGAPQIGYTPPNEYRPRADWQAKLAGWVQFPPGAAGSWQTDISLYWRWRTLDGLSPLEAWTRLRMHPNNAASALDRNSADRGLVPPEIFSRLLARSDGTEMDPNEEVAGVIIHPA